MDYFELLKSGAFCGDGGDTPAPVLITKNVTENGTYAASDDSADGYSAVTVNVPTGGGGSVAKKAVNFYDYDGTVVNSYTAAEFAALTAMPDNPSHDGLTAQGWNWSIADAKAYVASYGKLNVGQMYITSDGKTRLYIELTEGRLSPYLKLYLNANSELDIDWGDGSAHSTFTSTSAGYQNEQHNYASAGSYVIAITVVSGGFSVQSSSSSVSTLLTNNNGSASSPDRGYLNSIKKIEIGNGITSIGNSAFYYCYSLRSITIPDAVISIGTNAFYYCYSLNTIIIPDAVTSIGSSVFYNCYSLASITIPDSVTSIGTNAFYNCSSLNTITIPDAVTSVGNGAFSNCYSLRSITIPDAVTFVGTSAFSYCYSLTSITIPDSVTSISANAFSYCYSLTSITIPDSVTSVGNDVFSGCHSLSTITIPDSVTSIGTDAFKYCYSLATITIDKAEGSITGSPWGAVTSSPTSTQIIWAE